MSCSERCIDQNAKANKTKRSKSNMMMTNLRIRANTIDLPQLKIQNVNREKDIGFKNYPFSHSFICKNLIFCSYSSLVQQQ